MVVHVFGVPDIEGGARVVVHDTEFDRVVFLHESMITSKGEEVRQEALAADDDPEVLAERLERMLHTV